MRGDPRPLVAAMPQAVPLGAGLEGSLAMRSRPQPVFATHHAFNGAPSALPLKVGASPAECVRASPAARTLVGDFHDRFWLTREAHGDAAAAAATALAALSDDPAGAARTEVL